MREGRFNLILCAHERLPPKHHTHTPRSTHHKALTYPRHSFSSLQSDSILPILATHNYAPCAPNARHPNSAHSQTATQTARHLPPSHKNPRSSQVTKAARIRRVGAGLANTTQHQKSEKRRKRRRKINTKPATTMTARPKNGMNSRSRNLKPKTATTTTTMCVIYSFKMLFFSQCGSQNSSKKENADK